MNFNGQYLSYDEYKDLGGTLEEMPFNLLELRARKIIDSATSNRLVNLENQINEVKACIFDLIHTLNNYLKNQEKNITSESIDGYSVNYNKKLNKEQMQETNSIVRDYLLSCKLKDGTPYMYCGVE